MRKNKLKIDFIGFWSGYKKNQNNLFYDILSSKYDVEISNNPEVVFFYRSRNGNKGVRGTKVFYTGECIKPDFSISDYAITFEYLNDNRHYRLPNWSRLGMEYYWKNDQEILKFIQTLNKRDPQKLLKQKSGFCNFIYANSNEKQQGVRARNNFFKSLSKYKKVDSAGTFMRNIRISLPKIPGGKNKIEFQKRYKFSIAFENISSPGYTTEKIFQAFLANTIPIYWGDPEVAKEFNPKSFINCHNYNNFNEVIRLVKEIDNNDKLYFEYLNNNYFNKRPESLSFSKLSNFLDKVVKDSK